MQHLDRLSWCFTLSLTLNGLFATCQALAQAPPGQTVPVDLSNYNRESGVVVRSENGAEKSCPTTTLPPPFEDAVECPIPSVMLINPACTCPTEATRTTIANNHLIMLPLKNHHPA
jgi:hypothetical protein